MTVSCGTLLYFIKLFLVFELRHSVTETMLYGTPRYKGNKFTFFRVGTILWFGRGVIFRCTLMYIFSQ